MEVKCMIGAVYDTLTNEIVNREFYNQPIKKVVCEVGKPLKIFFENGGFFIHQVVQSEPDETDRGFWLETTTKTWRFDYI